MKKIPVILVTGAIVFMLSSCSQPKDAEEWQTDTTNNIWENHTEIDETDSDGKEDTTYDVLDYLTGEYKYTSDNGIGKLIIEKLDDGYNISDYEAESSYRFLASSSNIETIEDNRIYIKYPEQVFSNDMVIFSYYILEYSTDEMDVYYGKSIEDAEFLYRAVKKAENGVKSEQSVNITEDITGLYVCSIDDSTLSIIDDVDSSYRAAVDLFRLTSIDDFTGKYENGILTMKGTDKKGDPITSEITFSNGQAILTFTDSTWKYLENGTQYVFNKQINTQVDEHTDMKMTTEELLDSFINGKINAVSSEDPTATFYITDLKMYSEEWDSYSIGERVDLDNDGENELIIRGPYGGIYLDARDNKVYEFAKGDGTGLMLSYVVYNGATWIMYSSRMHAEYEVYYMKKFEGADHLVAEINFGEEAVDKNNIESGRKYTWNGTEISYEEYTALASKIFATEVNTN